MSENPVPQEGNTNFDFSNANIKGFIRSINADKTQDQTLEGKIVPGVGGSQVIVTDDGVGGHLLEMQVLFQQIFVAAFTVPDGVETVVATITMGGPGKWFVIGNVDSVLAAFPARANTTCRIRNNGAAIGECTHNVDSIPGTQTDSHSITSYLVDYAGGETVTLSVTQNSGVSVDYHAVLTVYRVGI